MLSPNTKAILLLTAPLLFGSGERSDELMTPGEYKRLAAYLRTVKRQPADLLSPDLDGMFPNWPSAIDKDRLTRLMARGFLLSQAVEHWQARAIWVLSRADAAYPRRLKTRLKDDAPAVLYGCGTAEILDTGGLAVVGSRNADEAILEYANGVGQLAGSAGHTLVSGGARGVDQAAMRGALGAGGRAIGVLADGLEKAALNREHRNLIMEGQLVLVSPYDPGSGFNVGHAMQRNKLIYALSEAALVVSAERGKGGTWAGAMEQLEKRRLVPVYVRSTGEASEGLEALLVRGALSWPSPGSAPDLDTLLTPPTQRPAVEPVQADLLFPISRHASGPVKVSEPVPSEPVTAPVLAERTPDLDSAPSVQLMAAVRRILVEILRKPCTTTQVGSDLGVTKRQAEEWLHKLVEEGVIEKRGKPVTFVTRQMGLFAEEPAVRDQH